MAVVTMPTAKFNEVRLTRRKAVQVEASSFTFGQKVYRYPGKQWMLEISLAVLNATEAAAWSNFLDDLEGGANTFNFNVAAHAPGSNFSAMTSVSFRLAENSVTWTKTVDSHYLITFAAMEVL